MTTIPNYPGYRVVTNLSFKNEAPNMKILWALSFHEISSLILFLKESTFEQTLEMYSLVNFGLHICESYLKLWYYTDTSVTSPISSSSGRLNKWAISTTGLDQQNFEPKIVNIFLPISLNKCLGAQKKSLIETVLLSTHNICFGWELRILFGYPLLTKVL